MQAELVFRRELEPENITVASHLFETLDDPLGTIEDLFVSLIIENLICGVYIYLLTIATMISSYRWLYNILQHYNNIITLQFEEDDYRVFLFNCYSEPARQILCKVLVTAN